MTPKEIQKVYDLALETWKARHFSAYDPEHQLVLCTILAFCTIHLQTTGKYITFNVHELPRHQSIDEE